MPNVRHNFEVERTGNERFDDRQGDIKDALDLLQDAINALTTNLLTFVVNGSNGIGNVLLPPETDPVTGRVLARAAFGYKLISAVNLTDETNVKSSFELTISVADQIRQLATTNLSAKKIVFVLAPPV